MRRMYQINSIADGNVKHVRFLVIEGRITTQNDGRAKFFETYPGEMPVDQSRVNSDVLLNQLKRLLRYIQKIDYSLSLGYESTNADAIMTHERMVDFFEKTFPGHDIEHDYKTINTAEYYRFVESLIDGHGLLEDDLFISG